MALFECGIIFCHDRRSGERVEVEVRRGMLILSRERVAVGRVAAVNRAGGSAAVTELLLYQPGYPPRYRLLPMEQVAQVTEEGLLTVLDERALAQLALRASEATAEIA